MILAFVPWYKTPAHKPWMQVFRTRAATIDAGVFGADQGVYFNCDWQTFMAMIRDLENRIANENGTDTTRAVYVSGEVLGNDVFMTYDCLVLRDSVLSLQQQLDAAIQPSIPVFGSFSFNETSDSLVAVIANDGGSNLTTFTFEYGANADVELGNRRRRDRMTSFACLKIRRIRSGRPPR